jgi:hypothetical protein
MGKKAKRNGNSNNKRGPMSAALPRRPPPPTTAASSPLTDQSRSLISIYKYATNKVLEWGRSTYVKRRTTNNRKPLDSLVALFSTCFRSLGDDHVPMPTPVLEALRMAIAYRKRVGGLYRLVPSASVQGHRRHEWLIVQMERVEGIFAPLDESSSDAKGDPRKPGGKDTVNIFGALSIADEDEEDDDQEVDATDETRNLPSKNRIVLEALTQEEIEAEERCFAIALVLSQISEARSDLIALWSDWAATSNDAADETEAAGKLVGATACTEYTVQALRKLIIQTSMEFEPFEEFDQMLRAFGETNVDNDPPLSNGDGTSYKVDDCVRLRKLNKRPELNGREGIIYKPRQEDDRFAVKLFSDNSSDLESKEKRPTDLSVKPENLVLADSTFQRLSQVYVALESFDFGSVPTPPTRQYRVEYGVVRTLEVVSACRNIRGNEELLKRTIQSKDYGLFLKLTMKYFLPMWISMAQFLPDTGAADSVMTAYLREYSTTRQIQFHFVFALMAAVDCAFAAGKKSMDSAEMAMELSDDVLRKVYNKSLYTAVIEFYKHHDWDPLLWYNHYAFTRYMMLNRIMGLNFPWISGESLLQGLRWKLECGSNMPFERCQAYTMLLHLYCALRCEGLMSRIPQIEKSLIRMYRKDVFFRGGVPQRGTHYSSSHLAMGQSIAVTRQILGHRSTSRKPTTGKDLGKKGLHASEISRLLDVLQWKSMPISNRADCFQELQNIASEETRSIFLAPLASTCLKLEHLAFALCSRGFVSTALACLQRSIENFSNISSPGMDLTLICMWGFCLADNRTKEQEKQIGLDLLAKSFKDFFEEGSDDEGVVDFCFNPNDHEVDPSLWGEEGARRSDNLLV